MQLHSMAAVDDLTLICSNGDNVHVASTQLINASCNTAFKEIIAEAMSERQGSGLAQLRVPEDSALTWRQCIGLLQNPATGSLSWAMLAMVLRLSDKYELKQVLEICQKRIIYSVIHAISDKTSTSVTNTALCGSSTSCFNPLAVLRSTSDICLDQGSTAVGIYVEVAILLYNAGLTTAYDAFIHLWIHRFHQAVQAESNPNIEKRVYQLISQLSYCLSKEPSSPASHQLAADFVELLPGFNYKSASEV